MMNFRLSRKGACKMLPTLLLINFVSAAELHGVPCLSNNICDSDSLCCKSLSGKQWCCPREQNCCSDEDGCCPVSFSTKKLLVEKVDSHHNEKMKANQGTARSKHWLKLQSQSKHKQYETRQKCDKEGMFFCDMKETCCKARKSWECCPYANGTCCGNLCCPPDTTCDSRKHSSCKTNINVSKTRLQMKSPTKKIGPQYILCPDDKRLCLDTNTCCLITNDTYGCCPYENAVCCSDLINCCPPNTICNIEMGLCEPCDRNLSRKRLSHLARVVRLV